MSTLRQAEAIMRIHERLGKRIKFDEALRWDFDKASRFIGENHRSYYQELEKWRNQR